MKNEQLKFSHNWNGKLLCDCFTTIRPHNPKRYAVGITLDVFLKQTFLGVYEVIDHKNLSVNTISDWIARLDTGYSKAACQDVIRTMYKNMDRFTDDSKLSYVLLRKIKKD